MSRPIKFRAWDGKKMNQDVVMVDGKAFKNEVGAGEPTQYTGVHDDTEEQEELYEGDIAEVEYEGQKHVCKVQYCGSGFMFVADSLPDGYLWISEFIEFDRDYCWAEGTRKVGNIYENPELLIGEDTDA
ncbi:YopX family protein [Paenibacillus sp. UMB4589-SE434]|uniref:YopX family protein n=1 Tax=Paenibacillus sp. UMB4589-SE434 TaxID=3046314 RepID=UPI00254A410E|nr:YopX family protein [Paenibacillus sp. UMB4589-SE434]MDK8182097.1 YopX family protein [Paenibacillus sp. UMB4589-SE434]